MVLAAGSLQLVVLSAMKIDDVCLWSVLRTAFQSVYYSKLVRILAVVKTVYQFRIRCSLQEISRMFTIRRKHAVGEIPTTVELKKTFFGPVTLNNFV